MKIAFSGFIFICAMTTFAVSLVVAIVMAMKAEPSSRSRTIEERQVAEAQRVVDRLVFVKHARSGLCFAYSWVGEANGGPALANVPCAAVENLLAK